MDSGGLACISFIIISARYAFGPNSCATIFRRGCTWLLLLRITPSAWRWSAADAWSWSPRVWSGGGRSWVCGRAGARLSPAPPRPARGALAPAGNLFRRNGHASGNLLVLLAGGRAQHEASALPRAYRKGSTSSPGFQQCSLLWTQRKGRDYTHPQPSPSSQNARGLIKVLSSDALH